MLAARRSAGAAAAQRGHRTTSPGARDRRRLEPVGERAQLGGFGALALPLLGDQVAIE